MVFEIKIPGRLPSWNRVLSLSLKNRMRLKRQVQNEFLSVLKACANDSATATTSAPNTTSIVYVIAASLLAIHMTKQQSKSASVKPKPTNQNIP